MNIKRIFSIIILMGSVLPAFSATVDDLIAAERELFMDLKYFLGVTNAENMSAHTIWEFMWPPYLDVTQALGTNMLPADKMSLEEQERNLRAFANYNIYTQTQSSASYYGDRLAYCGKTDKNNIQVCEYKTPGAGNDVLAFTLVDKLAYETENDKNAALQYIINLSNPKPFAFDPKKVFINKENPEDGVTEEGKKYFDMAFRQQPALTMAQNSLLAVFADRYRLKDVANNLPVGNNGAASVMELLSYEASRRYSNPDWSDQLNKLSSGAVTREIANMQAFQIYLDVKKYEQASRMEALMAAQVALLTQLNGQSVQATAAAGEVKPEELMTQTIGQ